ncbi:MAG: type II toxin-antitoxin system RelE/ParE family toxin [Dehalococcoidia bacterium]
MSYQVKLRRSAQKDLAALAGQDYEAVARAISSMETNPRPPKVKKLAEGKLWRIRVRQCRIVYAIDDKTGEVIIVRIARRSEDTYKKL